MPSVLPNLVFTTFGGGSDRYRHHAIELGKEASRTKWFSKVTVWTDVTFYSSVFAASAGDLEPESVGQALDLAFALNNERGFGYWIWKANVVDRMMRESREGDILVYLDAGSELSARGRDRFFYYVRLAEESGALFFSLQMPRKEICWNKAEVVEYLNVSDAELSSDQIQASFFLIKNTAQNRRFVADWIILCRALSYSLLDDRLDERKQSQHFVKHRHDQALLSVLVKRSNYAVIPAEDHYEPKLYRRNSWVYLFPVHLTRTQRKRRVYWTSLLSLNRNCLKNFNARMP